MIQNIFSNSSLVYDHQMALDGVGRTLYVFGGRLLSRNGGNSNANASGGNSSGWPRASSLAMLAGTRFEPPSPGEKIKHLLRIKKH